MWIETAYNAETCSIWDNLDWNIYNLESRALLSSEACRVNEELWGQFLYEIIDDESWNYNINIKNADWRTVSLEEFWTELAGVKMVNDHIVWVLKGENPQFDIIGFITINTIPLMRDLNGPATMTALYEPQEVQEMIDWITTQLESVK